MQHESASCNMSLPHATRVCLMEHESASCNMSPPLMQHESASCNMSPPLMQHEFVLCNMILPRVTWVCASECNNRQRWRAELVLTWGHDWWWGTMPALKEGSVRSQTPREREATVEEQTRANKAVSLPL